MAPDLVADVRHGATDIDVVVVGYGPVGMATAALLGRYGHTVLVLERYPGLYQLPRAGVFDDETMRTWAALGIAEELLPRMKSPRRYDFRNGADQQLIEFECAEVGHSGWTEVYGFYQPDLERALDQVCRGLPSVEVRHRARVTAIAPDVDGLAVLAVDEPTGPTTVSARYVVACDGGNSFIRQALDIDQDDYGFGEAWLVCDFALRAEVDLPTVRQVCDPQQPTAIVSLGPTHHRFSFMLDSEQDFEVQSRPENVWRKAARYLGPDDAELIRVGTYTFRSLVTRSWRRERVLLAGDAAHQMPPFAGQGMCSGIRDAQNLAFKLDLVLRGRAQPELLDTYQVEREPHVRAVTERGIELGRIQTQRDPRLAGERDRRMLAARAANPGPATLVRLPGLGEGFFARCSAPGRGELCVQGFVDGGAGRDRFDAVVGFGFRLLVAAELIPGLRSGGTIAALDAVGVTTVGLGEYPGTEGSVVDLDGSYRRWFADHGCVAVAVRPDFYVYGTAADAPSTDVLAGDLLGAIGAAASVPVTLA
jgi:3-(3-hydroxy-phenyl)propionate hydroxylase/flavoprotein hydroxylase